MLISNSRLGESSKCWVYSAVNHPWWMSMLFHRRGLLWLGSVATLVRMKSCHEDVSPENKQVLKDLIIYQPTILKNVE